MCCYESFSLKLKSSFPKDFRISQVLFKIKFANAEVGNSFHTQWHECRKMGKKSYKHSPKTVTLKTLC